MEGEGAHWYSLAYFSDMNHIFQNMGDGTYYHSGLLAVRGAVAAKVNMTFKILFNDAVAMTGGQSVDGPLTPGDITRQVLAEGAVRCVVVTDRPDLYGVHRSEEHAYELQSLMSISYAVFCLKKNRLKLTIYSTTASKRHK